jgi:hypothetical protein
MDRHKGRKFTAISIEILSFSQLYKKERERHAPMNMGKLKGCMKESEGIFGLVDEGNLGFSKERLKKSTGHYLSVKHTAKRGFAAETSMGEGPEGSVAARVGRDLAELRRHWQM